MAAGEGRAAAAGRVVARSAVVHGRVQGVFFRDSCREEAERAGVRGWVRNEYDGTVHVHLEGDPEAVEVMTRWLWVGPPYARVRHVDVTDTAPTGASRFEVR